MNLGRKGITGTSTTILKLKKNKQFGKTLQKRRQEERIKREAERFEIIQLPNGDFKKIERKNMSEAEFEAYKLKLVGK